MPKLQHPLKRRLERLSSVLSPCARGEPWVCQSLAEGHSSVPVNHNNALKASGRFPDRSGSRVLKGSGFGRGGTVQRLWLVSRDAGVSGARRWSSSSLSTASECRIVYPVVYFNRALVCKRVGEGPFWESLPTSLIEHCCSSTVAAEIDWKLSVVKWSPYPKQKTILQNKMRNPRDDEEFTTLVDVHGGGNKLAEAF